MQREPEGSSGAGVEWVEGTPVRWPRWQMGLADLACESAGGRLVLRGTEGEGCVHAQTGGGGWQGWASFGGTF